MIRLAIQTDYSRIAEIYNKAHKIFFKIYSEEEKQILGIVEDENSISDESKTRDIFVLEENNKILGYISLRKKNVEVVWISSLYIDPEFQNKGYGARLLSFAEEYTKKQSCVILVLETHALAYWAINFYEKNGFRDIKEKIHELPYSKILEKPPIENRPLLAKIIEI